MVDVDETILNLAEELCESMGLSIPGPELVKVAGVMVATESVKSALDLLIPSASTAMSFSTTGITLAFIQRKLREINKKIDVLLDVGRKSAKDKLSEALTSLEHENYDDAYEAFKEALNKATDGFHTAIDNESRVSCAKIKLFCILMIKCFDKSKNIFLPFNNLSRQKKTEVASLMRTSIDNLLDELRAGKNKVDFMDVLMFKAGVKRKMFQIRLNELFASSYRFMSEGLNWTQPEQVLDEDGDVVKFEVYPQYLPVGDAEDALELILGKGKKSKNPLTIPLHRVILDKKNEKIVTQKAEFLTGKNFDHVIMVEIFAGRLVAFRDNTMLLIDAARVGRSEIIAALLSQEQECSKVDVNAKNFKGESALISTVKSPGCNNEVLLTLIKHGTDLDYFITDDKGNTALHFCARNGNLEALQILSSKFNTLDILNDRNESPLSVASYFGQTNVVQFLLSKRVSLNHKDIDGCTPLFLASSEGHVGVISLLLKAKADPLVCRSEDGASPVWIAACNGHLESLKALGKVLSKQKLKMPTLDGKSPAKIACANEHVMVHMYLKKQGAA